MPRMAQNAEEKEQWGEMKAKSYSRGHLDSKQNPSILEGGRHTC